MLVSTAAFVSSAAADKVAWGLKFLGPKDGAEAAQLLADLRERLNKLEPAGEDPCEFTSAK